MPNTINDWENYTLSWCQNLFFFMWKSKLARRGTETLHLEPSPLSWRRCLQFLLLSSLLFLLSSRILIRYISRLLSSRSYSRLSDQIVDGELERQPKIGDTIQYMNKDGRWEKVRIKITFSRKAGYLDIQNEEGDVWIN